MKMETAKSLDELPVELAVIASLLHEVQTLCVGYSPRDVRLDLSKITRRVSQEGLSFLTIALPRLGKALDRALQGDIALDATGFRKGPDSKLPRILGTLFKRVFAHDGRVLPTPCVQSIGILRQITYQFYKYELPCDPKLDEKVLTSFQKTEVELSELVLPPREDPIVCIAQRLLKRLLCNVDVSEILPKHGPGAVSTKEQLSEKFLFRRFHPRLTQVWPFEKYFTASLGHYCDRAREIERLPIVDPPAKVCLVPKDSRGRRIISCEPLENQWIQQGLRDVLYRVIEHHPLTRGKVNFTDQTPNRNAALAGSKTGSLATLDLKDASDRVSMALVELLFPEHIVTALEAARSTATILPDKKVLHLLKHAPMGSALCFPILALSVWAILRAAGDKQGDVRKHILVYGDDVIVPQAFACTAIEQLERFGLRINRDKSCINGLFRESCGMDAYCGIDVTPVRFRTVWSSSPDASALPSWVSYANSLWKRGFEQTAEYIAARLLAVYGHIPSDGAHQGYPSFCFETSTTTSARIRTNPHLQNVEKFVWVCLPIKVHEDMTGWDRVLRYFSEHVGRIHEGPLTFDRRQMPESKLQRKLNAEPWYQRVDTEQYTLRRTMKLVRRWRTVHPEPVLDNLT